MNHRFLLRLVTNLAFCLLTLSCFGTVLWVIDEFLGWDILPNVWGLAVRALLVAGAIITFAMLVMNVMLSLALLAEANASQAQLPDYVISRRFRRRIRRSILAGGVAIVLLIGGLQIVNQVRAQEAIQTARAEFNQTQMDMNQTTEQVLKLFTPALLEGLGTNMLPEKGQLSNLSKLFSSIQASFPHRPTTAILVPATQAPYQYARIDSGSIQANNQGQLFLSPQLYTGFPSVRETEAVEQLFSGQLPEINGALPGNIINNTVPSSWGVLRHNGRIISLVYLRASDPLFDQSFHHDGPEKLLSN